MGRESGVPCRLPLSFAPRRAAADPLPSSPAPPKPPKPKQAWRKSSPGKNYDFSMLDRANGAGWDLAKKLLAKRDGLNRGRLSVGAALRHRYFSPLSV